MAVELATAYISLVPSLKGAGREIQKQLGGSDVQKAVGRSGDSAGRAFLGRMTRRLGKATLLGVGAAIGTTITLGLQRSLAIEDAQAKLEGLGHSTNSVSKIMENALAAVKGTAFGLGDAAGLAATMAAAGIEPGREMERILTLVGDSATVAGTDLGDMGLIWGKVAAKGKVDGQIINQMLERQVPILDLLAEHYGTTAAEVSEMVSAGKVSFDDFAAAMEAQVGGAAQRSGDTTRGAFKNMLAAVGRVGEQFLSGVFPMFKGALGGITDLLDAIAPAAASAGAWLASTVENATSSIQGLRDLVASGDFSSEIRQALGVEEDSALVGFFLGLRDTALGAFEEVQGGFRALVQGFKDGGTDVTSGGFAGFLESLGLAAREFWDAAGPMLKDLAPLFGALALAASPMANALNGLLPVLPSLAGELGELLAVVGGSLVEVLPTLTSAAVDLGGVLGGALGAVLPVLLPLFADLVKWVVQLVTPILSSKVAVLGIVGAFTAWKLVTLGMAAVRAVITGITAATYGAAGATYAAGAASKVYNAMMAVTKARTIAVTVAQRALNLAMRLNPIGLIITAITALVGGLVWFFTKTETGKRIVQAAWSGIQSAIAAVSDWWTGTVVPAFNTAVDAVGAAFQWVQGVAASVWGGIKSAISVAWTVIRVIFVSIATVFALAWKSVLFIYNLTIRPIFEGIENIAVGAWNFLRDKVFTPISKGWKALADAFGRVKKNNIDPVWNGLKSALLAGWNFIKALVFDRLERAWRNLGIAFQWVKTNVFDRVVRGFRNAFNLAWGFVRDYVFAPLKAAWEGVGRAFAWVKENVIDRAIRGFRNLLRNGWNYIRDSVFNPLKRGVDAVGSAFETVKDVISAAWNSIKAAAAGPVNFVIETIYNDGIKATWDKIADAVGLSLRLPTISPIRGYASGGVLPGYTPGRDVHNFYSPTGGRLALSGGEAIMRPEFTRAVGGPAGVARLNAQARSGRVQAFANGGVFGSIGNWISDRWGDLTSLIGSVADFISDPASGIRNAIMTPINSLMETIGGGKLGQLLVEFPRKVVRSIIEKAKDLVSGMFDGGEEGTAPGRQGWANPSVGPITSRYGARWGAFHAGTDIAGGGPTYAAHAGRVARTGWNALSGRTGIGIVLSHGGGQYTYYGHNPPGGVRVSAGDAVRAGQRIGSQGATGNVTGTHLHFETHTGGLGRTTNPEPFMRSRGVTLGRGTHDQGGWIPHGGLAMNLSGRPEAVLDPDESAALKAGLLGGHGPLVNTLVVRDERTAIDELERMRRRELTRARIAGVRR